MHTTIFWIQLLYFWTRFLWGLVLQWNLGRRRKRHGRQNFEACLTALGPHPSSGDAQAGRDVTATLKPFAYAPRYADLLLTAYERRGHRFAPLHRPLRALPYLSCSADRQFTPPLVRHF